MNKPIMVALAIVAVFFSATAVAVPAAYAQYGVGGGGSTIIAPSDEQLQRCAEYGIPREKCTENEILAIERRIYAEQFAGAGSGTPMLSTEEGQTWVFIGVLAAIFGGVAAAFFFRGRGATPPS